ncbi:MAG: tetratricopeptide repeat protein [Phycisphaerales bacterium]
MRLTKRGKKRLVILCVTGAVLIAAGGISAWLYSAYKIRQIDEGYGVALEAKQRGDYEAALKPLSRYVGRHNTDVDALIALAETRSKIPLPNGNHLRSAISYYNTALTLKPDDSVILEGLLEMYRLSGRRVEMLETAARVLKANPDHEDALSGMVWGLRKEGSYDKAAEYSERLVALDPTNIAHRYLHVNNLQQQGVREAALLDVIEKWIADEPDHAGPLMLLKAVTLSTFNRNAEAIAVAREGAAVGADESSLEGMLEVLDRMGLRDESKALVDRVRAEHPRAPWLSEIVIRREWQAGRIAEARQELDSVVEEGALKTRGLLRLAALLYAVSDEPEKARAAVGQLAAMSNDQEPEERDRDRAWGRAISARLDVAESSWSDALDSYEAALSLNPDDPIVYYLAGEAHFAMGEYERAAGQFERAFDADPAWVAAGSSLAESYFRVGRLEDAFRTARELVLRTSPRVLSPWRIWLQTWVELETSDIPVPGMVDATESRRALLAVMEDITSQNPEDQQIDALTPLLARAYLLNDERGEAQDVMRTVLNDPNASAALLLTLAEVSFDYRVGLEEELLAAADRSLGGVVPASAAIRARIRAASGDADGGLSVLDKAIAQADNPGAYWRTRMLYLDAAGLAGQKREIDRRLASRNANADDLAFILSLPVTWDDRALVAEAIEQLEAAVGPQSRRVVLARATETMQFKPNNAAEVSKAILALDDMLAASPNSLPARSTMARLLLLGDNPDVPSAIAHLEKAIEQYPTQTNLYPQLIELLQKTGDHSKAERYLIALSRRSDPGRDIQMAQLALWQRQGQFERAIALQSTLMDQDSPVDGVVLASLHQKAGRIAEAEQLVGSLLERFPSDWIVLRFSANFYATRGETERGLALLQDAKIEEPGKKSLLIGAYYHNLGEHKLAEEALKKSVSEAPDNATTWLFLAQHYLGIGDREGAQRSALAGLEVDPDNEQLRVLLASVSVSMNRAARREAIKIFQELRGDNRALIDTMKLFDRTAQDDNSFSASESDLAEARMLVQTHPGFLPAWRLAVLMHTDAGKAGDAIALARDATAKMPTDAEPAMWVVDLYRDAGQAANALQYARIWRQRTLDDPMEADMVITAIGLAADEKESALRTIAPYAKRIVAERSRYPLRFSLWLRALLRNRQIDRAFEHVKDNPGNVSEWLADWLQASMLLTNTDAHRALSIIEPLAANSPRNTLDLAMAWTMVGTRAADSAMLDRAEQLAISLTADDETRVQALRLRAMLADARGNIDEALTLYEQILREDPNDPLALNNNAYLLNRLNRIEEAEVLSSKLIRLYPGVPEFLDTHAQVLLGGGQLKRAETAAREAINAAAGDPGIMITLARTLVAQGQAAEARQWWEKARQAMARAPHVDAETARALDELDAAIKLVMDSG